MENPYQTISIGKPIIIYEGYIQTTNLRLVKDGLLDEL